MRAAPRIARDCSWGSAPRHAIMTDGAQQGGMDAADHAAPREDVPVRDEVPAPAPPVEKELPSLAPPVEDDGENLSLIHI